ncbi:hypothetical protein ACFWH4_24310, partial [Streptomyces sp. NPDC127091]|uniref:hypothetical protein n=1 Tax=Streptomyces sp. NPDC127091 TaxID=3347134 RepID=UPI00364C7282
MGTAERYEAPEGAAVAQMTKRPDTEAPNRGAPAAEPGTAVVGAGPGEPARAPGADVRSEADARPRPYYRPLWVEEPARRRRLPDPVRTAAVRAVLIVALTLIQAMVALLCTLAGSWLAFPMVISSVVSTILATWGVLDVWVTRQVWNQRNGVVSSPSSTARARGGGGGGGRARAGGGRRGRGGARRSA